MTEPDKSIIRAVSDIREFQLVSDLLNDPEVDDALSIIVKLSMKGTQDASFYKALPQLINRVQAQAAGFSLKAKVYMVVDKTDPDASKKKNLYLTLADSLDKLANSLKYAAK